MKKEDFKIVDVIGKVLIVERTEDRRTSREVFQLVAAGE